MNISLPDKQEVGKEAVAKLVIAQASQQCPDPLFSVPTKTSSNKKRMITSNGCDTILELATR